MTGSVALVLAGGETLWDDLDDLEAMMGGAWPGVVIVCNDVGFAEAVWPEEHKGRRWDGPLHHWATLHAEKGKRWKQRRGKAGLDMNLTTWSSVRRTIIDRHFAGWTKGSSGLYGVSVALRGLGCPRAIGCGIPMDGGRNTFSGKKWNAFQRYRRGWLDEDNGVPQTLRSRFRSMSGWTRETFGAPTVDWIGLVHMR